MFAKLFALSLSFFPLEVDAGVRYDQGTHTMTITGATTSWQYTQVKAVMDANDVATVVISGNGGMFYAGLAIGRLIRDEGSTVIIPKGAECISACALSAIASDNVIVDGSLLFHRVYSMQVPANQTIEQIAGHFGKVYLDWAMYMQEMGYSLKVTHQILVGSSPCKFLVISDSKSLQRTKRGGFLVGYKTDDRCG